MIKAVVFDFDGTLTPEALPVFEILERSGLKGGVSNSMFLEESKKVASQEKIDIIEAMTRVILDTVRNAGFELTNENFSLGAAKRAYNRGVSEFLHGLNKSGVKLYILSSGLKTYLKQTEIAPLFTEIFASTFAYGENNEISDIETVMSIEQKAKNLRRLAHELNGNEEDCRGIFYFGDGLTDIEAMKFIKQCGGKTVLVYSGQPAKEAAEMVEKGLVDLFTVADYSENSKIYNYIISQLAEG